MKLATLVPVLLVLGLLFSGGCAGVRPMRRLEPTLLPSRGNPLVAIRILFRVGSIDDPKGKEGLAALTAAMIAEGGSKQRTYKELLDALYPMAAAINVQTDKEVSVVLGTVHRDNLDAYYDLLREVLLEPRFDPSDFERLKADQINYIENVLRATDDENLGKEALGAVMYEGNPYGRPTAGTLAGIRSIAIEDVKAFYTTHYTREACELGLTGGYPPPFVERVQADLARLPEGRSAPVPLPAPRAPGGIETTIVTKPARAWAISIGYPTAITRADDDFYALMIANSYLGEHRTFNGVLMNKLRGERGFNYGDYSYVESFIQEGGSTFPLPNVPRRSQFFSIWIRPLAPENAHFAIRGAMRELDRLVKNGLSQEDFETTRDFILNYSRLWTQTVSRRLGYEMDGNFYGRQSLVDEVRKRLPSMTVDQVNLAVRKHLQSQNAYLVVVADEARAKAFGEALTSNAPSPVTYETETQPEVLAEDREIAVFPLDVRAERLRIVPAVQMFER